jgi:hypothetical protein
LAWPGSQGLLQLRHLQVRRLHARAPGVAALAHRLAQRVDLDVHAQVGQVLQVGHGDGGHAKTALPLGDHQRVADQAGDGLAQRAGADAVARLQVLDAQLLVGRQAPVHDIVAQLLVGALDQRARGRRRGVGRGQGGAFGHGVSAFRRGSCSIGS